MGKAVKRLWGLPQDELEQERMEAIEKQRRDRVAELTFATEKGIEKSKRIIALKMLKKGLGTNDILECTGLAADELEELKQRLHEAV